MPWPTCSRRSRALATVRSLDAVPQGGPCLGATDASTRVPDDRHAGRRLRLTPHVPPLRCRTDARSGGASLCRRPRGHRDRRRAYRGCAHGGGLAWIGPAGSRLRRVGSPGASAWRDGRGRGYVARLAARGRPSRAHSDLWARRARRGRLHPERALDGRRRGASRQGGTRLCVVLDRALWCDRCRAVPGRPCLSSNERRRLAGAPHGSRPPPRPRTTLRSRDQCRPAPPRTWPH